MDNVLQHIKMMCGIPPTDTSFDIELITLINTTFNFLSQLGVEEMDAVPEIHSATTWTEVLQGQASLNMVKEYVSLKVRLMFDPPANSTLVSSYENAIRELEWRICNRPRPQI